MKKVLKMVTNDSLKDIIIDNFKSLQKETMFLLKAIPQDKLEYSPCKQMKRLDRLAKHIAVIPFTATLYAEEYFCDHPTPAELNKVLDETFGDDLKNHNYAGVFAKSCDYFLSYYNTKCDDSLVNKSFINPSNNQVTPYLKSFLNVQNHLATHTGNLGAYIRELLLPEYVESLNKVLYVL